jgi:hypothetical protein
MKLTIILSLLMMVGLAQPAPASERINGPMPDYLKSLSCRVVTRAAEPGSMITLLVDASLDTMSKEPAAFTFDTPLHNGKVLTAKVQHVYVRMPRERFNVTLLLDGKPHLRMNHVDLEIYAETAVDGRLYALHCFGETP